MAGHPLFTAQRILCAELGKLVALLVAGLLLAHFPAAGASAQSYVRPDIDTVVLSGIPVPGLSGSTLSFFRAPTISPNGRTTFVAYSSNTGAAGLYAGSAPNDITLVGAQYQQAPGAAPGIKFYDASAASINASGQIAVNAILTGASNQGTWLGNPAIVGPVWMSGLPTPLPSGLRFGNVATSLSTYSAAFNDSGQVAVQTGLQTSAGVPIQNAAADWITIGNQMFLVAQTGGPVPGLPPTATFTGLGTPGLNNLGTIVYSGAFSNPAGPVNTGTGIWLSTPGYAAPVAMTGMPLPELGPDVTFHGISLNQSANGSNAHVNAAGQTVFQGQIQGSGVQTGVNDRGVWRGDLGSVCLVARTADAAPGLPVGSLFSSFPLLSVANNGAVAVLAQAGLPGAQHAGIWTGAPGDLHKVAYFGDTVSDGPHGMASIGVITSFAQNAIGEIAFQSSGGAIFGQDQFGRLHVLARPNDLIQVMPGDFRTISDLLLPVGNEFSGGPTVLNDHGEAIFLALFTDGTSGVFISNELVPLAGDTNADGIVNGQDFAQVASNWLTSGINTSDVNFDGIVNGQDFALIASNWLGTRDDAGIAAAAAVPEPATVALLIVGAITCGLLRQRKRRARA